MDENPNGPDLDETPLGLSAALPPEAPAAERFAAMRRDFDGLVEICRWQWNLIQRLRVALDLLPKNWPTK